MTPTEQYIERANQGMVEIMGVSPETIEAVMQQRPPGSANLDKLLLGWVLINRAFALQIVKKLPEFDTSMTRWLQFLDELAANLGAGKDIEVSHWNPTDLGRQHTN